MKKVLRTVILTALSLFIACCIFPGCNSEDTAAEPRQEVSLYEERTEEAELPLKLGIDCDYAEIEVYSWERKQAKFEITRRIRGSGNKEELERKLEKLSLDIKNKDKTLNLKGKCGLPPSKKLDCIIIIRMYIPKRVSSIDCNFSKGRIKFLDDVKGEITVSAKSANVEINRLEGRISQKVEEGGIRISSGELDSGSEISTGKGNIDVTASFSEGGAYVFDTGSGMIRLKVPRSIKAAFEYSGAENSEYADEGKPARFKLRSGMGDIVVVRT